MKILSRLGVAAGCLAVGGATALSAVAAPAPAPGDQPKPTATVFPSSRAPVATVDASGRPASVTPPPSATVNPLPVGPLVVGTLTWTAAEDCRTFDVSAAGYGSGAETLTVRSAGLTAQATMTSGAATARLSLPEGVAPDTVTATVSGTDGHGVPTEYSVTTFRPSCAVPPGRRTLVPPALTFSVPACLASPDERGRARIDVVNHDAAVVRAELWLHDVGTGEFVGVDSEQPFPWLQVAPGEQGTLWVDLPVGAYGQAVVVSAQGAQDVVGAYSQQAAVSVAVCPGLARTGG